MIKIAICDDESNIRAYLSSLIGAQSCPCEIVEYASAGDCLADHREIDLLFLDIELAPSGSGLNGMALARKIRERATGTQPVIVFVTGYERYVFDAFDVGAFQYLLKPVDKEKFAKVFSRAVAQIGTAKEKPGRVLTLQSANTSRTVPLDSIYYIESSNHKVELHLKDGEFACYAKIGDLELELQDQFFRIHKGYLVNLVYVAGYSKGSVTLTNGEKLLLSKYKYQDFVKAYLHFLKKGAGL
ncbi:DNA-binding response regulator [Colidextribacter sp. OB.20]|uniref:LytR/AlgR family response regulator transcription factor n=1 Tax=Colidextribacter sp. OB.20 TaxID=2304568 RepID=UPI00136F054F|nr:LytTR family DNA-binding domain-containing protein [Colidextribacter sp. OB.20]NBI09151.1 DNA-binding response regulator [Colidextribacter sp. OB.20]